MRFTNKDSIIKMNKTNQQFHINEVIGVGGSCIAYRVSYKENDEIVHYGILKEYCPAFLEKDGQVVRDADNNLIIPIEYTETFKLGLDKFKSTYKIINDYLINNLSASNYHTVQLGYYEENNTAYTLTSCDSGKSYEKIEDKSLHMLLKLMLSVTKAVEMYHNAGFLHLDIKPKNILVLDDVTDLVKLFDFDSLISIDGLKCGNIDQIPVTGEYYVPELNNVDIRNIGISTDIFEIGAMLFTRLFGRTPKAEDMSYDTVYDFANSRLMLGCSPKVKYEITDLLKNTLQISAKRRYQSTAILKEKLEKIISLVEGKQVYISNLHKWQPSKFAVGRTNELKALKNRLDKDGYVFVKAMGGTGKSELAKLFAQKYSEQYHTVQFCKYTGSLKALVAAISVNGINDNEYKNLEQLSNEKNKVLHSADSKTLIIVDNFNVTYDEYLREFLPANSNSFKVIFTTRCMPVVDYCFDNVIELNTLDEETALGLFYSHSKLIKSYNNDEKIKTILEAINYNTLILVLLAKSMVGNSYDLQNIIEKLNSSKLEDINLQVFHEYDFLSIDGDNYNNIFAHLNTIFNISNLSDIQKEILLNMSIVADLGIEVGEFIRACESYLINRNEIEYLCDLGWIEKEDDGYIVLHPIVSDLIFANKTISKKDSYDKLSYSIIGQCYTFSEEHIDLLNVKFAFLYHLNKRLANEINFRSIDVKVNFARAYTNLYMGKQAKDMYDQANAIIEKSFRFKPRYCFSYFGLGEVEEEFGYTDEAIKYYEKAIYYCRKTVNYWYEIRLKSICGIASCYVKKHDYPKAYEYYVKAYNYIQKDTFKETLNSMFFVTDGNGTKNLAGFIPAICNNIIEVCEELEFYDEIDKYKRISSSFVIDDEDGDEYETILEYAKKSEQLMEKGEIKEGCACLRKALEGFRDALGENSPEYKSFFSYVLPVLIFADKDEGKTSLHELFELQSFIKESFGENSLRMIEFLTTSAQFLVEVGEMDIAEKFALKAKAIYIENGFSDEYYYQLTNLIYIYICFIKDDITLMKKIIDELDINCFSSKSDYEFLVKHISMPLWRIGNYKKCKCICLNLLNKVNVEPSSYYIACTNIAQCLLDENNPEEAITYLEKGKSELNRYTGATIKEEYICAYYFCYARAYSDLGDNEKALSMINNYLFSYNKHNLSYVNISDYCSALNKKIVYLRCLFRFDEALEIAMQAKDLLDNYDVLSVTKKELLINIAICLVYDDEIDEGYEYFLNFKSIVMSQIDEQIDFYIDALLFFIDMFSYKGYAFNDLLNEAEEFVEEYNLKNSVYNARLENYIGIYVGDYEKKYGYAQNHFETAKNILDNLNMQGCDLYFQIEKNIDYARNKVMSKLIKDMAESMADEQTAYNQEESDD